MLCSAAEFLLRGSPREPPIVETSMAVVAAAFVFVLAAKSLLARIPKRHPACEAGSAVICYRWNRASTMHRSTTVLLLLWHPQLGPVLKALVAVPPLAAPATGPTAEFLLGLDPGDFPGSKVTVAVVERLRCDRAATLIEVAAVARFAGRPQ